MGTGPIPATRKALDRAGWKIGDLDLVEANEAFAAQALAVNKDLGWDVSKVNVNGGAIALGHPIGASGARILVTLMHEMQRRNAKKGLADALRRRRHGRGDVHRACLTEVETVFDLVIMNGGDPMASESENPAAAAAKLGENVAAQLANAANIYGGAFAGSMKAVQDYQTKLLHFFQTNAEANMALAQKLMTTRSPSDYIETVSSHMRERAAAIGDQAKELAALGQEAAKKAMDSLAQPTKNT